MVKWGPVIAGFILAIILGNLFAMFGLGSYLGLFIAGLIVGYWVHEGVLGGLWNATVSGAFGSIVLAILFIIGGTVFGGLAGFAAGLATGVVVIIWALIANIISMGIGGAIGGLFGGN